MGIPLLIYANFFINTETA